MKLTPARRVLLAAAILLWLFASVRVDIGRFHFQSQQTPLAAAILLVILMLELRDKLVARDELEAGRVVQLALMPAHRPDIAGWDVWLYTRPANDVGGDLVDHLHIDERRHFVALGDVAGKALPAALLSVKLQATLRALAPRFDDLGELGSAVNRILQRDGIPSRFASLVYLLLSEDSGHVRLLNGGHMPPLLVHNRRVTPLERGSMVLGMMPEATFSEQQVDLESGDCLVVYSDGISEAMNEAGDFFGDDRLVAVVEQGATVAPAILGARVLDAVATFVADAAPNDDLSLIVLKRS
jgi:sigma-B regulation protein RsbU (phosphoserine phosphatase)